ncbi:MAG: hypothetical protein R3C52_10110 [Hyphomonadaceae bacterium]
MVVLINVLISMFALLSEKDKLFHIKSENLKIYSNHLLQVSHNFPDFRFSIVGHAVDEVACGIGGAFT